MKLKDRVESVSQPKSVPPDVAQDVYQGTLIRINQIERDLVKSEATLRKLSFRWLTADGIEKANELEQLYSVFKTKNDDLRRQLEHHQDTLRLVTPRAPHE